MYFIMFSSEKVGQNKNGPNISAIIDGVSGAAAKTGKISVGDMLVSINGSCMTDFSFIEVLDELKQASRPVELTFVAPPSPSNPDLFPCYTCEDPTRGLPESVKLLVRRDTGLQIVDTDIGATVAFFPWQMMPSCHSEVRSLCPTPPPSLWLFLRLLRLSHHVSSRFVGNHNSPGPPSSTYVRTKDATQRRPPACARNKCWHYCVRGKRNRRIRVVGAVAN